MKSATPLAKLIVAGIMLLFGGRASFADTNTMDVGPSGWAHSSGAYYGGKQMGWKVSMNESVAVQRVTINGGSALEVIKIYNSSKGFITNASISARVAVFSPNVILESGKTYYIVGSKAQTTPVGGSGPWFMGVTFPRTNLALNITAGIDNTPNADEFGNEDLNSVWDIEAIEYYDVSPPVITVQPQSQTVFARSTATFVAAAIGSPLPSYQWLFNGTNISGATNSSLVLTNVQLTNAGDYAVVASNIVGSVTSSNALLTVFAYDLDTDSDGLPDWWEIQNGLSLSNGLDAVTVAANDLLTYLQKFQYGLRASTNDNDGDGLTDYDELFIWHSTPLAFSTVGDGVSDGAKVAAGRDPTFSGTRYYYDRIDRLVGAEYAKGLSLGYQYDGNGNILRQIYLRRDSTTNGLPDLWEFLNGLTNNASAYADSDGDGWSNYQEWKAGSNPLNTGSVPTTNIVQTAPIAAVLPSTNTLGSLAVVTVRLWDAEGNASTPFLQYSNATTLGWSNASLVTVDGITWNSNLRVFAPPGGTDHFVVWNALTDLGPNVSTNVYLRSSAQDITLRGNWSAGTLFQVTTSATQDSDGDGLPDWWEIQYFLSTAANPNDDPDGDGFKNWQEYIADTNPNDRDSCLRINAIEREAGGVRLIWQGGEQARQYLQRIYELGGTNTWTNLLTTNPPTAITNSYLDTPATNRASFYRIQVEGP